MSVAAAALSFEQATDVIVKFFRLKPDPEFDRIKYETEFRARRAAAPPIVPGGYDPIAFTIAYKQFRMHPAGLTERDLEQLTLVDRDLGDVARAARVGFKKNGDAQEDEQQLARMPVSALTLLEALEKINENIRFQTSTLRRLARETSVRVDAIEQRLADPKDAAVALARVEGLVKTLVAKVEALEQKPSIEYHGVFKEGASYEKGAAVTRGGCLWIATAATMATPGDGATPWRLAVKAGRDGKDLR